MNYTKHISILKQQHIHDQSIQFKQRVDKSPILQHIFSQIQNIKMDVLKFIQIEFNKMPYISIQTLIDEHLASLFISPKIKQNIINKINHAHQYTFTYKSNTLVFNNFLFKQSKHNITYKQIVIMALYGHIIMEIYNKQNVDINTYLFPSTYKKTLPKKSPIQRHNINTGYTTRNHDHNDNYIVLFRKEDVENVFVHECIHYLKIDHLLFPSYAHTHSNTLQDFFKFSHSIFLQEGYTEILTILYVSLCNAAFLGVDFKNILYNEFLYSLFQCNKILQLYSISNHSEFYKWSDDHTNSFAYVFIKTICLENLHSFLTIFFDHTSITPQLFVEYIKDSYVHIKPYLFIDHDVQSQSKILQQTLKKSIYDIQW